MYSCSICKLSGHNKQTCPSAETQKEQPISVGATTRKTYTCSTCSEPGHNSRKCPKNTTTLKVKTSRHCKACGESGHNVRTCAAITALLTITEAICMPCSPSATYKRSNPGVTQTIGPLHIPVEDNHVTLQLS